MFGFLQSPGRTCCSSESHLWRGYFCGLANTLHRDYGRWARILVNRDSTFLSLLGGVSGPPPTRLANHPPHEQDTAGALFPDEEEEGAIRHGGEMNRTEFVVDGIAAPSPDDDELLAIH